MESREKTQVFLKYQRRYANHPADILFIEKSRRIGITYTDAAIAVMYSAHSNGDDSLYISYNEDFTREYIQTCAEWARRFNIAVSPINQFVIDSDSDAKAFRIDFPASGNKIIGMSSHPRNLRGKQGRITIDEAAYHDNLQGLMEAAPAILMWGGKVRVISTHNGRHNTFNKFVRQIRNGELPYGLMRVTFDDAIKDGFVERRFEVLRAKASSEVVKSGALDCTPEQKLDYINSVYAFHGSAANQELRVIPKSGQDGIINIKWLMRYIEPPHLFKRIILSIDSGQKTKKSNDPSCIGVWGETATGYYLLHVWLRRVEYPTLKRTLISYAETWEPDAVLIEDKSSGIALIQELRENTIIPVIGIEPVQSKQVRLESVSSVFEAHRVYLPESAPWLADYETELTQFPDASPGTHDDQVDMTSQAIYWLARGRQGFQYQSTGNRSQFDENSYGITDSGFGSVAINRPS